MLPSGAGAMSSGGAARGLMIALRAWRSITWRRGVWTTAIALTLLLANTVGLLPALLGAVPVGGTSTSWNIEKSVGGAVVFLAAAYCFLLAVGIAEHGARRRLPSVWRYVVAGLAACGAAILIEMTLYTLFPRIAPTAGGRDLLLHGEKLLQRIVWSAATFGLSGGLALAVYVRFRAARFAREAFNAANLERVTASREVLATRLAAMQARVEPSFLLGTLAQVEALYERDPHAGARMLDGFIAYLHAALPQLRSQRSTLQQELHLAETYLRVMQIRMGPRLDFRVAVRPEPGDFDFPPMVLLPLIDDALRNGLEPLPHGGTIAVTAEIDGNRLRVRVTDDGPSRPAAVDDGLSTTAIQERLHGLYGNAASLRLISNAPKGAVVVVEVPLEPARNHC